MKRDLISLECCAIPDEHVPDFYVDADGVLVRDRRSRRARMFRAEARHQFRWSAVLIVFLLVMVGVQRVAYERAVGWRDAEIERLQPKPAVMVKKGCADYVTFPRQDTGAEEACNWTVYRY